MKPSPIDCRAQSCPVYVKSSLQRNPSGSSRQMVPAQHWQPLFAGSQEAPSRPQHRRPDKPSHSGLPATLWHLMRPEPLQHFFPPPHVLSLSLQRFFFFFLAARSFKSSLETRPVSPAAAPTRSAWRRWALAARAVETRSRRAPFMGASTFRRGLTVARAGSSGRQAREAIPTSLHPARRLSTASVGAMSIPRRRPPGDAHAAGDRMTGQPRRAPWPRTPSQGA